MLPFEGKNDMKIQVQVDALRKKLQMLKKMLPETAFLRIYAKEQSCIGGIREDALEVNFVIAMDVKEQGAISIPLLPFSRFLDALPASELTIETKSTHQCVASTSLSHASFPLEEDTFFSRHLTQTCTIPILALPAEELLSAVEDVAFSASKDMGRPFLTCVHVEPVTTMGLDVITTDSFRMAHRTLSIAHNLDTGLLIPARDLACIASSFLRGEQVKCLLRPDYGVMSFQSKTVECSLRLLKGLFPPYRTVYPSTYSFSCTMHTEDLQNAVRIACIYDSKRVNIILKNTELCIESMAEGGVSGGVYTPIYAEGDADFEIEPTSFLEVLSHVKTKNCSLHGNLLGGSAAIILSPDDNRLRFMVMPLARRIR